MALRALSRHSLTPRAAPVRRLGPAGVVPAVMLLASMLMLPTGAVRAVTEPASPAEGLSCPEEKELCVQAERSGGIDLKTGIVRLEGDVRGLVRSQGLSFTGQRLTAFREGGEEWVRLVLEQDVRLVQGDREAAGDQGVLERGEIRLTGHVRITMEQLGLEGHEALIRAEPARTEVRGEPDAPVTARLQRALLHSAPTRQGDAPPPATPGEAPANGSPGAPTTPDDAAPQPVTTLLQAQSVVVEGDPQRVVLTGGVHIAQSDDSLGLDARQVTLLFGPDDTLESFRAEGDVRIRQPERRISADFAQSRNQLETILLVGNARMQEAGQFDLTSDRMEVYANAGRGVVQSHDRRQPITLSLDLAGDKPYGLTGAAMLSLTERGVPARVLEKLAPLLGRKYPSRGEFRKAVTPLLTRQEADRHLDTILSAAPLEAR